MKHITYGCGCKFQCDKNGKIDLNINIEDINLKCPATWGLISDGNTKGCFQLESRLGQAMAKQLKPTNIEQLAGLISIMRPGCLEAYRDGKSVSNHYMDKKNGNEAIDFFHPELKDILESTYGEMVYQEQAMQICQKMAGFDLQEADQLRKAIGKKNPAEMKKLKKLFMKKTADKNILSKEESEELFGWIEKSQRYSFNKSHAVSYAYNAYLSAFVKTHFPKEFFTSYLKFSKDKIDPLREIQELISNANEMDIEIKKPDITKPSDNFFIDRNDQCIRFGISNIKNVGSSVFNKMKSILETTDIENLDFFDLFYVFLNNVNSSAAKALISCGAINLKNIPMSRNCMLFYFDILSSLTPRELAIIKNIKDSETSPATSIKDTLSYAVREGTKINKNRKDIIYSLIKSIDNPPYSLEDSSEWIANNENFFLGTSITCKKIDGCDIMPANTVCKDLNRGSRINANAIVGAEITDINVIKTKRGINPGQEMAFIKIEDSTATTDLVVFPSEYAQYRDLLFEGNTLLIKVEESKKKSFCIKKCWQV